ncbi:hypothetical protein LINPERHAP2_LOCUS29106 [Linum perenne]
MLRSSPIQWFSSGLHLLSTSSLLLRCCDGNGTLTSPVLLSWPLLVFSFSSGPLQFNGSAADSTSSPLHLCCSDAVTETEL